jgi:hypothetical protein
MNDHSDENYISALTSDSQATAAKQSFVAAWNAIAPSLGQPTIDPTKLF